jgi:hypothetical protein
MDSKFCIGNGHTDGITRTRPLKNFHVDTFLKFVPVQPALFI